MRPGNGRGLLALVVFGVAAAFTGSLTGADAADPGRAFWPPLPDAARPGGPALDPLPRRASPPVELRIPTIGVRAPVVPVGLRPDGAAEVPAPGDAGWWRFGAAPGAPGSAVLLGHRDTAAAGAVFAHLPELRPGDLVEVRRADGLVAVFAVRAVTRHDKEQLPRELWRGSGTRPLLRLVTCGGPFDRTRGSYRENVVAHAEALGAWRPRPRG